MIASPRITGPRKLHVLQGSPEWLAARRDHITATAIPVLLGISPWRCEQDLADEILTGNGQESTLKMRVGNALEDLIASAYSEKTGRQTRRVRGLWESSRVPWAAASLDRTTPGRIVELKWSGSRSRFAGELPDDVAAQVQWQMFVAESPVADVAALTVGDDDVKVFEVPADAALQEHLVAIAFDFRARLARGGPFAQSPESIARHFPTDNGTYLPATPDLVELVDMYRAAKETAKSAVDSEKGIGNALRALLRDASGIEGLVTYHKNADSTRTNWPAVASGYRALLDDLTGVGCAHLRQAQKERAIDDLDAIQSIHSETSQGPRVLRLLKEIA